MKTFLALLFTIGSIVTLSSCATPYQIATSDSDVGFHSMQIDSITYSVWFTAVGNTPFADVNRYEIYGAAQLTIQKGYDHFIIMGTLNSLPTIRMYRSTPEDNTFETAYDARAIVTTMAPNIQK
jgi:hypothetical protein